MINKQSIWFLTLFGLVLVLGIYYIAMPTGYMETLKDVDITNDNISVYKEDKLMSLRVQRDEETLNAMENIENKISSNELTSEEKNSLVEELKILNLVKGKETTLEEKILNKYNIKAFVKISGNQISITIDSNEHNVSLANNIMRLVQEEYEEKVYVTVKFNQ